MTEKEERKKEILTQKDVKRERRKIKRKWNRERYMEKGKQDRKE